MHPRWIEAWCAAAVAAALAAGCWGSSPDDGGAKSEANAGKPGDAHEVLFQFNAFKSAPLVGGGEVTVESLRGQVVLLDIFGTWCEPCRKSTPIMVSLYERFHAKGLAIVGLAKELTDDAVHAGESVRSFREEFKVPYPLALCPDTIWDDLAEKASARLEVPTILLVDRQGVVRYLVQGYGLGEEATLADDVEKLLAEPTGAVPAAPKSSSAPKIESPAAPPAAAPSATPAAPPEGETPAATRGAVQADFRRLCDIWRKTEPEPGKPKGTVTAEERALLLQELDGHRGGIAPHDFRRMAAITLGNLQAREAVPKLIARLRDGQEHGMTRAEAARALGEIGDKSALAPLLDALGDEREAMDRSTIRVCAARALGALAPTPQDLNLLATPERFRALLATVEAIALPVTEPERLNSASVISSEPYWTTKQIDALCLGLNLARPAELPAADRTRAANLARKLLQSGLPIYAFIPESCPDVARFCQAYQPDLYAERTKALHIPPAAPKTQS